MSPQAEQFEAQERLRRMKLVAEYLEKVTQPDDPMRINFVNYVAGYASGMGANPCDDSVMQAQAGLAGYVR